MFSYYGSKSKIIHLYPPPMFGTVVEPFAGSARYALRYPDRKVVINDLDPTIYGIWKWLVEEATVERVMAWPELKVGERLDQCDNLTQEERDILGFAVVSGADSPRHQVTLFADKSQLPKSDPRYRPNGQIKLMKDAVLRHLSCAELTKPERDLLGFVVNSGAAIPHHQVTDRAEFYQKRLKNRLNSSVSRIKHWKVRNVPYYDLPNIRATWYVDPPYCGPAGRYYKYNQIDYERLAEWCRTRKGQVIVCEGAGAEWLPFRPLGTTARGTRRSLSAEKWWSNYRPATLWERMEGSKAWVPEGS